MSGGGASRLVSPATIAGTMAPPPSKSAAHRALIAAALAGGGEVRGVIPSADMRATLGVLTAMGVRWTQTGDTVTIHSRTLPASPVTADCEESGSTLRFLLPVFAALGIPCTLVGRGRLPERPLDVYLDRLPRHGVTVESGGGLPLTMRGRLQAGSFTLRGDVSSQFVSGLLFALPLCEGDSEIVLSSPLESAAYVDMTLDTLAQAGIAVESVSHGYRIPGGQTYRPQTYTVEGDWSQAAFLLAMGTLGGELTLIGVNPRSRQGDRAAADIFKRFGAEIGETADGLCCRRAPLHGITIDAAQIPDLVPILAVVAASAQGETRIINAARLRLKESDRLAAVTDCLRSLGVAVTEHPDGLTVQGTPQFRGGVTVRGWNDHRIVMSMAVAALRCDSPITITETDSVNKSWPTFFQDYEQCGGVTHVLTSR